MSYEKRFTKFSNNYHKLIEEIELFSEENGKNIPKLISVSKTRSIEELLIAKDVGITEFGENYAQELDKKASQIKDVKWHFIGHLQRSNTKYVLPHASYIHTIDSLKLVNRLHYKNFKNKCMIQVNISNELNKSGVQFSIDTIQPIVKKFNELNIDVIGLMGIPNSNWNENLTLKTYKKLDIIRDKLSLKQLSIGMSNDWKVAILGGSTMLRIGTAIFGPRK